MSALARLLPWLGALNYDVAVRTYPVARALREADPERRWRVLDVGSGAAGVAAFLPGRRVAGLDLTLEDGARPHQPFVRASALALPFADRTWDAVTCIDVIEHVPLEQRAPLLAELVRVGRHLLVVAFPCGDEARAADEALARAFGEAGQAAPAWVSEHLAQAVPTAEAVEAALRALGTAAAARRFNESLALQRVHRRLARTSPLAYRAFSLLCALGTPWLARPRPAAGSYRCILSVPLGPR
ncbi:MAG TPA: class I SAM-dependent methyltransferase [Vicinamibacteria bacterium]